MPKITKDNAIRIAEEHIVKKKGKPLRLHDVVFISDKHIAEMNRRMGWNVKENAYWAVNFDNEETMKGVVMDPACICVCVDAVTGKARIHLSL